MSKYVLHIKQNSIKIKSFINKLSIKQFSKYFYVFNQIKC